MRCSPHLPGARIFRPKCRRARWHGRLAETHGGNIQKRERAAMGRVPWPAPIVLVRLFRSGGSQRRRLPLRLSKAWKARWPAGKTVFHRRYVLKDSSRGKEVATDKSSNSLVVSWSAPKNEGTIFVSPGVQIPVSDTGQIFPIVSKHPSAH